MHKQLAIVVLATSVLAGCGTTPATKPEPSAAVAPAPGTGGYLPGDGPGVDAGIDLDAVPDAVPRNEPLHRYANRPYIALGKTYTPLTRTGKFKQRGAASWYGKKFHGQRTSSGEVYDMYAMTAAHPTLPIPSYARVTNLVNGKSVVVRINDRGPFLHERVIDVSYSAAHKLGIIGSGSGEVEVESIVAGGPPQASPIPGAGQTVKAAPQPVPGSSESGNGEVYLQLGAFKSQESAESFMERMRADLGDAGKQFKLTSKNGLVRVHIGPYASESEARESAERMRSTLGFKPMVNLY